MLLLALSMLTLLWTFGLGSLSRLKRMLGVALFRTRLRRSLLWNPELPWTPLCCTLLWNSELWGATLRSALSRAAWLLGATLRSALRWDTLLWKTLLRHTMLRHPGRWSTVLRWLYLCDCLFLGSTRSRLLFARAINLGLSRR